MQWEAYSNQQQMGARGCERNEFRFLGGGIGCVGAGARFAQWPGVIGGLFLQNVSLGACPALHHPCEASSASDSDLQRRALPHPNRNISERNPGLAFFAGAIPRIDAREDCKSRTYGLLIL